jgi:hypothetical protein
LRRLRLIAAAALLAFFLDIDMAYSFVVGLAVKTDITGVRVKRLN